MFSSTSHREPTSLRTKFRVLIAGIALVTTTLTAYAIISPASSTSSLATDDQVHPWETEPSSERERAHLEAARFLTKLNFYEDGHGLVLPPSITMSRIEALFGVEKFAALSGLVYENGQLYGVSEEELGSTKLLVSGCAACHIGKAAGRVIPGLGNKTADLFGLANATRSDIETAITIDAAVHVGDSDWQRANEAGAKAFSHLVDHPEYDSGTAGSVTQFFAVEMAFEQLGLSPLEKPLFAPAKAPSLWGYGPKRQVGVFSDALLKGLPAGAAGLPLFIGNYSMELFEKNMDTYEAAEKQFEQLLPPKYPFEIDHSLTRRGQKIFKNRCTQCHGDHQRDQDGLPIFERPEFIDLEEVGTDPLRATVYDTEAQARFEESPVSPYLQATGNDPGYIAPNLWGVWARFPYLHNGSVASLKDLLTAPEDRPKYIDLVDIGEEHRFDQQRLGATPTDQTQVLTRVKNKDRWVFNANRKGFGNGGHDFGTDLSDDEKRELIEYLKTL